MPAVTFTVCGKCPFRGFLVTSLLHPWTQKEEGLLSGVMRKSLGDFPNDQLWPGTLKGADARASLFCLSFSVCPSPSFFPDKKPGHSGSFGVLIDFFLCLFFENIPANSDRNLIWTVNILLFLIWAVIPS